MMSLFHPYKVHPQRSWTLEETKIPLQRAWTVEETKIPHRPNSAVRAPRRDFRGAVVVNPSFQKRYSESEEDMEPQVMETPLVPHGPHRVAIKRENINVVRKCEWDVKSIKDDNFGEKTLLSKKLVVLIGVVCVTSIVSLVLTLLILFGSVETRNCSCGGNKGVAGTDALKSVDGDRIDKVSENITTMNKRLEIMEGSNKEREKKGLQETNRLKMLLQEQDNRIKNLTYRLKSTQDELKSLKNQLATQMVALWNTTISTTVQLSRLKGVWIAVNTTAEKTSNLTAKMDQEFKNVKRSVNETNGILNNLKSSLQGFKLQVNNEMDRVWLNLNQSRKCCTNLTTFLKSFKANVTYRSERLEARVESEEQKSSNTSKVTEKNLKKIQGLENLLNVTRQDAREMSRRHFIALWSAGNLTKKEIHRVWTAVNTSQVHLLGKIRKVDENLTEQMNNEMESVWLNLNQSRRCCTNLTIFLKSFKANVTYRSEKLEARIKSEEQKLNSTSKVTEKNLKQIQDLQNLLNVTRQDAREVSWQHLTALWSAGNRTKKEIHRVWTAVNTSQVHLLGKLRRVEENLTEQLNLTAVLLQASDATLLASLVNVNSSITEKVNNVSKMAGPIGPPGFNGSQGPAGPAGLTGPPGPKGSGDFSSCQYKVVVDKLTAGNTITTAALSEPNGKRLLGVSCSTNYAAEYNLFKTIHLDANRYTCICRGTSTANFKPFGGQKESCFLHYWECPLTT